MEKYIHNLLYDNAVAMKCYCTWLIEYPTYDREVGFEFKVEVTSEDKHHQVKKIFFVEYDWEKEQKTIEQIAIMLLKELQQLINP